MRWEDERYIRLYTRDTTDWLALSFDAQALLCLLLRKVDRAGLLPLGRHGKKGVAIAVGHPGDWPRLEPALEELLADGCVRLTDDGKTLFFPNFISAQEARASDKARQQKARELAAALASAQNVTRRDIQSRHVTECHTASHGVTSGHAESHRVTPSLAVPSLAVPSLAERTAGAVSPQPAPAVAVSPTADDIPDATDAAEEVPTFSLEAQEGPQQPRGATKKPGMDPGPGLKLYARLEAVRRIMCEEAGVPFVESRWSFARQAKELTQLAKLPNGSEEQERFEAAWAAFGEDPQAKELDVPYSLDYFWKCRSRYEGRGLKLIASGEL